MVNQIFTDNLGRRKRPSEIDSVPLQIQGTSIPTVTDGMVHTPPTTNSSQMVDTSQPPPIRAPPTSAPSAPANTPLMPTPGQLPMMPPGFTMPRKYIFKFEFYMR